MLDDGRGHLQSSPHRYDYVAVAITGAAFAGVGSLYTEDFFQAVRSRLEPEGVFLIWVQLHHVRPRDVRSVVLTLARAFPHVQMYATPDGRTGLPRGLDPAARDRPFASCTASRGSPRLRAIMEATRMDSLLELTALNVFSTPEEIAAYAAGVGMPPPLPVVFTDFRPGFEYGTPYGLAEPSPDHQLQLLSRRLLPRFAPDLDEYGAGAADGAPALRRRERGRRRPALSPRRSRLARDILREPARPGVHDRQHEGHERKARDTSTA